jgi:hypothetical protein
MNKIFHHILDYHKIENSFLPRKDIIEGDNSDYPGYPGLSHYKLLSYYSHLYQNEIIINISHDPFSDIALASNNTNIIYTFRNNYNKLNYFPNIRYIDDENLNKWSDIISISKIVFIDLEPHNGIKEYEIYKFLKNINYQGCILVDDIWYFKQMRDNFWFKIPYYEKIDLTKFGHWTGLGLIKFCEEVPLDSKWTFVTSFQDDSSITSANTTMSINANLIVFCKEKDYYHLEKLRPDYLKDYTKYIILSRNISSVIEENHFQSTHFCWINICIEKYGYNNILAINDIMKSYRDKISICCIDYKDKNDISFCSDFFTTSSLYIKTFCNLIEQQCFQQSYLQYPDIFDIYFGDINSIITNYEKIVDINNLNSILQNSFLDNNFNLSLIICKYIWNYCFDLNPNQYRTFWNHLNTKILGQNQKWFLDIMMQTALKQNDLECYTIAEKELSSTTTTTTIVSGFINIYKYDSSYSNKRFEEYIHNGKKLIELPIPKVIFIDKEISELLPKNNFTTYIEFSFQDFWLYPYIDTISKIQNIRKENPSKNCNLYLVTGLQKTDWMKKAIELNPFNSEQFMWLDFGICHIIKDTNEFNNLIIKKCNNLINPNVIYSPTCKKDRITNNWFNSYYLYYPIFYFAGGMFIGSKKSIDQFDKSVKKQTLKLLQDNKITFEVNVWYMIYLENHQLFSLKSGDHNITMFY